MQAADREVLREESTTAHQVEDAEEGAVKQHEVLKSDVKQRSSTSTMPPRASLMSRQELRDLVEYAATQSAKAAADQSIPVRQ